MLQAEGKVIARHGNMLTVRSRTRSGCGHCAAQDQCGVGVVSKALPGQAHELQVPITVIQDNDQGTVVEHQIPSPGDSVTLVIDEPDFLRSAAWLYLPPLVGLLGGALAAHMTLHTTMSDGDMPAMLGGAAGAIAGWFLGRARLRRLPAVTVDLAQHQLTSAQLTTPCDDPGHEVR